MNRKLGDSSNLHKQKKKGSVILKAQLEDCLIPCSSFEHVYDEQPYSTLEQKAGTTLEQTPGIGRLLYEACFFSIRM